MTRLKNFIAAGAAPLATLLYLTLLSGANSPVADAAMHGDLIAVRSLLEQKADVNAPQADGATAIHWAVYRNDVALADALIAAKADVKIPNRDGATALRLAALNGSPEMLSRLLKAGADANETDANGQTPLMFASRNGNPAAIKVLLAAGAKANVAEKLRGTTPLMWAVEQVHPEAVQVLVDAGANVSARSAADTKGGRAYLAPAVGGGGFGGGTPAGFGGGGGGKGGKGKGGPPPFARGNDGAKGDNLKGGPVEDDVAKADAAAADARSGRGGDRDGGMLTPLVYAARQNCIECAKILMDHGADVNQTTNYGWSPLLVATQNRNYQIGKLLLEHGANPNVQNKGGWSPLYLATDNRNIEGGDYPVPRPDMDHLEYIKLLLAKGANPNVRVCAPGTEGATCRGDSTETRTNFTMQWLREEGCTPFVRAAQSSDTELLKVLMDAGADPKIECAHHETALAVASGLAWVQGVTFEWSKEQNLKTVRMLLDLGIDPNIQNDEGRAALHGAAHKGYTEVIQMLVDAGAKLDMHDKGSRDTGNGFQQGVTWEPIQYAQGLVRVGVQSAIEHPEAAKLMADLMRRKGLPIPDPPKRSICLTPGENGCQ